MWSSDDSARRPVEPPRPARVHLRVPLVRDGLSVPWRCDPASPGEPIGLAAVVEAAAAVGGHPGAFLVGGGDPLQRPDLGQLLAELSRLRPAGLGLSTSGHGLTAAVLDRLRGVGVQRLHVPFHCARQDAHDWLVGRPGALKVAHRAIRTCLDADLPVAAEIVLTRPTTLHLAETVQVLARLGVRTIWLRRLTVHDTDSIRFVPLSPRLELLEQSLEQAATAALEQRVRLSLRDLPVCVAPRLRPLFAAPESEAWVLDGSVQTRVEANPGCATCPGWPQCAGAPRDYVARFGWEEFVDPAPIAARVGETVVEQQQNRGVSAPMTFSWRGPHRVRCEACGDTAAEQSAYESTRIIRARLVEAARYRPSLLRLVGADLLAHPQAALLVYDAVRLFPHVEVAGEASAIVDWTELDLRRLKDLQRIDVALYGPDAATHDAHCGIPGAFAAMLRGVERVRRHTSIAVGAYAVLHDARMAPLFAEAWERGGLPGAPQFRLSARGASLDELLEAARALPPGRAHAALLAVLPRCLTAPEDAATAAAAVAVDRQPPRQVILSGRSMPYQPCGSDPVGSFEACEERPGSCALPGCPGTAVGWHSSARAKRWTASL